MIFLRPAANLARLVAASNGQSDRLEQALSAVSLLSAFHRRIWV